VRLGEARFEVGLGKGKKAGGTVMETVGGKNIRTLLKATRPWSSSSNCKRRGYHQGGEGGKGPQQNKRTRKAKKMDSEFGCGVAS